MEERVRIDDKVASAILNASSGFETVTAPAGSSRTDNTQQVSSDAEVGSLNL
jgi:hypothetical protein